MEKMEKITEEELKEASGGELHLGYQEPKYHYNDRVKCLSAMDLGTGNVVDDKYSPFEKIYYYNVIWPGRSDWIREDDLTPSTDPWGG